KHKATSSAPARFVHQIAAMGAGDLASESQTQSRALNPTAQRIVRAIKLLENLFGTACRHAEAAIHHLHFHMRQSTFLRLHSQRDFFLLIRIFFGVREQVDDYLCDGITVSADRQRLFWKLAVKPEAIRLQMRAIS